MLLVGDSHWWLHKETQTDIRDLGNSVSSSDRWKDLAAAEEQQPFQQKQERSLIQPTDIFLLVLCSCCYRSDLYNIYLINVGIKFEKKNTQIPHITVYITTTTTIQLCSVKVYQNIKGAIFRRVMQVCDTKLLHYRVAWIDSSLM